MRVALAGLRGALAVCLLAVLLALPMPSAGQATCSVASIEEFGGAPRTTGAPRRPEVHLTAGGSYCLADDIQQRKLLDPRTGHEMRTGGGDALILIGTDDIRLDLGGHTVANRRALGYTLVKHYRYEPGRRQTHWIRGTHVRNGRLLSPGSRGIGLRLTSAGMYAPDGFGALAAIPDGRTAEDVFAETAHLVEGLDIDAGHRAVLIDGKRNVIRNNRIVVDSATAIVAQGPGVVIENNVIEVRNDLSGLSDYARGVEAKLPFPIRLIQADGAIVRNNEIRLVDPAARGVLPAAIELLHSADVLVESNRFEGVGSAVAADLASSYRESGSQLRLCGAGKPRFLPPAEAAPSDLPLRPACR